MFVFKVADALRGMRLYFIYIKSTPAGRVNTEMVLPEHPTVVHMWE